MHNDAKPALHVGIIMDGNGRWAESRGLNRIAGHVRGARRVTEIVRACPELGITHLTLYAFSTENWQRPLSEIDGLMRIFSQYIRNKIDDLKGHDVRVRFIGMRHRVPPRLRGLMESLEGHTRYCRGLELAIAIDYGGRDEITRAVRRLCTQVAAGSLDPEAISGAELAGNLDTAGLPDPDFIIRTSGEHRVSNFLIWQSTYAEYFFPDIAWPDFTSADLEGAIDRFRGRDRRFGAVASGQVARIAPVAAGGS